MRGEGGANLAELMPKRRDGGRHIRIGEGGAHHRDTLPDGIAQVVHPGLPVCRFHQLIESRVDLEP